MGNSDRLIAAISRIHAAGLDSTVWPEALSLVTDLIGGNGASLEFLNRPSLQPHGMYTHGLPDVSLNPYIEHYAAVCPRLPYAARQAAGAICFDGLCASEAEMDSNPFYAELLAPLDMRYFVGAVIATSPQELVISGVQLSRKQGHPGAAKIKIMAALVPHIQQATDVMRRLGNLANLQRSFEDILNWLADGVLSFRPMAACATLMLPRRKFFAVMTDRDASRCRRVRVAQAGAQFAGAMRAVAKLRDGDVTDMKGADFIAEARSGAPPFSISIRPASAAADLSDDILALMFIHDPLTRDAASVELLRQAFGLTPAEADVANGLRMGLSPGHLCARPQDQSQHRLHPYPAHQGQVGCTRMTELIRSSTISRSRWCTNAEAIWVRLNPMMVDRRGINRGSYSL